MSDEERYKRILKQFELPDEDIDFLISFAKTVDAIQVKQKRKNKKGG